jgi:F0F1-type ATP synthase alpha subunit
MALPAFTDLEKAMALELVEFPGGILGLVLNLEEDNVGVAVMGEDTGIKEGDIVKRTGGLRRFPLARRFLDALLMPPVLPWTAKAPSIRPIPVVLRWWHQALLPVRVCMNPATRV